MERRAPVRQLPCSSPAQESLLSPTTTGNDKRIQLNNNKYVLYIQQFCYPECILTRDLQDDEEINLKRRTVLFGAFKRESSQIENSQGSHVLIAYLFTSCHTCSMVVKLGQ
jgi:hypothetical protein